MNVIEKGKGQTMDSRLNILLFMTDHQRADSLFMEQCGREVTPNLNQLAREGMVFERAYDTCPLCVPARTALATGIYPTKNGVVYNDWEGVTATSLEPFHKTLQKAGYEIGHIGVDHIKVKPSMRQQGLDFFINQEDYEDWAKAKNVKTVRKPEELTTVQEEVDGHYIEAKYSGHKVSIWENPLETFKDMYFLGRSLEFLRRTSGEKPFAMFTYLWAPHPPLRVPEPYASMYPPENVVLPENVGMMAKGEPSLRRKGVPAQLAEHVSEEEWREAWSAHLALTTMADEVLGTILEELKRQGKYENTCIIVTSDHGDNLGQHRMYQKMEMYEEAVKVPLVIRHPGAKSGHTAKLVSHLDLKPTLCEIAGTDAGEGDGHSLLPFLEGKADLDRKAAFIQYSGNPSYGTIRRAMVTEQYKYVYDSNHDHELYDFFKDPHEMNNVAADPQYQEVLQQLYQECKKFHQQHNDYFDWEGARR